MSFERPLLLLPFINWVWGNWNFISLDWLWRRVQLIKVSALWQCEHGLWDMEAMGASIVRRGRSKVSSQSFWGRPLMTFALWYLVVHVNTSREFLFFEIMMHDAWRNLRITPCCKAMTTRNFQLDSICVTIPRNSFYDFPSVHSFELRWLC